MTSITESAKGLLPQIIEWRRALHQIPELAMETEQTGKYICEQLEAMGIPYRAHVAGHGVTAVIEGKGDRIFGIRADCDGLPIKEETGLPFASQNGCMHACGHDAHTAMGLACAKLLKDRQDVLGGTVKLIFQPGEEGCPEGYGGAKRMIDDGALDNPRPEVMIGLHTGVIWREDFKPGDIGYRFGSIMACMDRFEITVKGKGSHGAYPHDSIDPVSIACQIIVELQTLVSREVNPLDPAVVSIGKIHGGTAFNIIPGEVQISGTVRALTAEVRSYLARRIEEIASSTAKSMRGSIEFYYGWEGPEPVVNDEKLTEFLRVTAVDILGEEKVKEIRYPSMGGEDFAFYGKEMPSCFFFLPSFPQDAEVVYPHHNSRFDIDESCLWVGPAVMVETALRWLAKGGECDV